jgi:hypothetical protein
LVIFTKLLVIFTHFSQNCLRKLPSEGSWSLISLHHQ